MDPDPGGPKTCGSGGSGSGTMRYSNDDITGLFIFSSTCLSFALLLMSANFYFFLLQAPLRIAGAAAASPCRSRMQIPAIRTVRMTTDWVRCRPTGRRRSRTRGSPTSSITTQVGTSFVVSSVADPWHFFSGSGSCYFRHNLRDANKNLIFYSYFFLPITLWRYRTFTSVFKDKKSKSVTK